MPMPTSAQPIILPSPVFKRITVYMPDQKIQAVKECKDALGVGLKDAKDIIDDACDRMRNMQETAAQALMANYIMSEESLDEHARAKRAMGHLAEMVAAILLPQIEETITNAVDAALFKPTPNNTTIQP